MTFFNRFLTWFSRLLARFLPAANADWWLKVKTQSPSCIYYFGPFESKEEARLSQSGYLEDLMDEGAQKIKTAVEKARPQQLTCCASE
jgi:hypothetical protein